MESAKGSQTGKEARRKRAENRAAVDKEKKGKGAEKEKEKKTPVLVHTKRKEVVDGEGWTHVVDAPQKGPKAVGKGKGKQPPQLDKLLHLGDFEVDGVSYVTKTLTDIKSDYAYWKKQWEEDEACTSLKERLREKKTDWNRITNVVFFGMGSLQSARREGRRASATQLAALQTILGVLGKEVTVVVQDPQFTGLDKEFFKSLGYTVVEDPKAFGCITDGSLVYAIHCYSDIYKSVSDGPRPAALIGTDAGNFGKFNSSVIADEVGQSLGDMVKSYEDIEFPQIRHDFSDTRIYLRKETQSAIPIGPTRLWGILSDIESREAPKHDVLINTIEAQRTAGIEAESEVEAEIEAEIEAVVETEAKVEVKAEIASEDVTATANEVPTGNGASNTEKLAQENNSNTTTSVKQDTAPIDTPSTLAQEGLRNTIPPIGPTRLWGILSESESTEIPAPKDVTSAVHMEAVAEIAKQEIPQAENDVSVTDIASSEELAVAQDEPSAELDLSKEVVQEYPPETPSDAPEQVSQPTIPTPPKQVTVPVETTFSEIHIEALPASIEETRIKSPPQESAYIEISDNKDSVPETLEEKAELPGPLPTEPETQSVKVEVQEQLLAVEEPTSPVSLPEIGTKEKAEEAREVESLPSEAETENARETPVLAEALKMDETVKKVDLPVLVQVETKEILVEEISPIVKPEEPLNEVKPVDVIEHTTTDEPPIEASLPTVTPELSTEAQPVPTLGHVDIIEPPIEVVASIITPEILNEPKLVLASSPPIQFEPAKEASSGKISDAKINPQVFQNIDTTWSFYESRSPWEPGLRSRSPTKPSF